MPHKHSWLLLILALASTAGQTTSGVAAAVDSTQGDVRPDLCRTRPDGALCRRWKQGVGEISRDVDANEVMWEFFRQRRLKVRISSKIGSAE